MNLPPFLLQNLVSKPLTNPVLRQVTILRWRRSRCFPYQSSTVFNNRRPQWAATSIRSYKFPDAIHGKVEIRAESKCRCKRHVLELGQRDCPSTRRASPSATLPLMTGNVHPRRTLGFCSTPIFGSLHPLRDDWRNIAVTLKSPSAPGILSEIACLCQRSRGSALMRSDADPDSPED